MIKKVSIIGGGIVGLATALKLKLKCPALKISILEKESNCGMHQSTHNSGVLHAGLYYKPGSSKAKLAVSGIRQLKDYSLQKNIPFEICGKLVVATDQSEVPALDELFKRGLANGLQKLRLLEKDEIKDIEPYVNGVKAVHVPEEGIIDYKAVIEALKEDLKSLGVEILLNFKVQNILYLKNSWSIISVNEENHECDFFINCAGLYCDKMAELAGLKPNLRIIPFRGEYYLLKPRAAKLIKNLIYPVPNPNFPFLGVHFTRLIGGGVEAGPNAVLAMAREGYKWDNINLGEFLESLSYPGLWHFLYKYPKVSAYEVLRSLNKRIFCNSLNRLVPEITLSDLFEGGSGVRAQAIEARGELIQDFKFLDQQGALHLLNAPSPAATASLAIGDEIVSKFEARLALS